MDQSTHDVRRTNWLNIIEQCQQRPENMTVKQWLADNGIKEKSYYYWLRKFRKEAYEQMQMPPATSSPEITFAEISVPLSRQEEPIHSFQEQPPAAIVKNGALSIAISNDISEALLDRIFQVIRHA